ncbi:MAG: type II toxin-antitoxin system VapC family toxin [Wenzhouxiangella sp.]
MNWLLDSNILIDYLNGIGPAADVIGKAEATSISRVTWIEVLVGADSPEQAEALRAWLAQFTIIEIDGAVSERAVELRQTHRLRLPDLLIWASAQVHGLILVSRNTRDFPADQPGIHVPYRIQQG